MTRRVFIDLPAGDFPVGQLPERCLLLAALMQPILATSNVATCCIDDIILRHAVALLLKRHGYTYSMSLARLETTFACAAYFVCKADNMNMKSN